MSDDLDFDTPEPIDPSDLSDKDVQRSAVDPDGVRKIRNKKKRSEAERAEFWRGVFSSEIGRREMWAFLEQLHPFNSMFGTTPAGGSDERATWMHLAEQLAGQEIYQRWFGMEPDLVTLMRQENDRRHQKSEG